MTARMSRAQVALLSLSLVSVSSLAFAQGGVNSTQAQALFEQGKDLIKDKKYHEACERFQASLKLEENNDTMLALARCHDLEGKNATAWGEYLGVLKKSRGTPAGDFADDAAKELYPRLSKVKLVLATVPPDLDVKIDGVAYPKETLNADLPLDPGPHKILAKSEGRHDFEQTITVPPDGKTTNVNLSLPELTPEELAALKAKDNKEEVTPADPVKRWIGIGMIGAGAVGIIVGVALIPGALSNYSKYKAEGSNIGDCPVVNGVPNNGPGCHSLDSKLLNYNDRGNAILIPAIIVGAAGVVLATVGTILVLTSFESKKVIKKEGIRFTPSFAPGYAGVGLSGTF